MVINNVLNSMLSKIAADPNNAIMFPIFEEFRFNHTVNELDSIESDNSEDESIYFSLFTMISKLANPESKGKVYLKQLKMQKGEEAKVCSP